MARGHNVVNVSKLKPHITSTESTGLFSVFIDADCMPEDGFEAIIGKKKKIAESSTWYSSWEKCSLKSLDFEDRVN